MAEYKRDRRRADRIIRKVGVMVVLNKKHVRTAEHLVTTMWEIYQAGFVAECTFRIDSEIIGEAMREMTGRRAETPADNPLLLGVGSIINPDELQAAIEMGFDCIVAPANVMGSFGEGAEFVRICHEHDIFCAPAVFTPTELQYFIERKDGLEPDAVKVFPANSHGAAGIKGLLAPFVRPRHADRIIMPTGGVNHKTGAEYRQAIASQGFTPVLGMSAPLQLVEEQNAPGEVDVIRASLEQFRRSFQAE